AGPIGRALGPLAAALAPFPPATATVAIAAAPATPPISAALAARLEVAVVGRVHVRDVQETVAADAEIDKRRLGRRLDVDDPAFINVADVTLLARALDIKFFEQ